MIDMPKATKGRRMSKKTQKKSSKTSVGKAARAKAATPSKTPAAQKRPAKKPVRTPGKRPAGATTTASHQTPSKALKPPRPAAAARSAIAQPRTAKPAAAKPQPETMNPPAGGQGALVEGAKAPAFRLPRDGGATVSLADFAGQKLLLFFYPRADTPGCTKEAIDFTRLAGAFADAQTTVLGISADPLRRQESFRDKHQLAIPLVSDEAHETLQAYGVWGEKSMYGKTFLGISRTTVLIGPDGRIMRIWRNVKVDGHADEVLAAVRAA
jgi:thioredoxin-dependent peroxiredoxin